MSDLPITRVGHAAEVSCPWCREVATIFTLSTNHGWEHGFHWGYCLAQSLTRNHVTYATKRLRECLKPDLMPAAIATLERDIARATQLWAHLEPLDWLDDARELLKRRSQPSAPTAHALVGATSEVALW